MASDGRHTVPQMAAEFLRELGVLLVAFAPLDYIFAERNTALTTDRIGEIVAIGVLFFLMGMGLERIRRP